MGLKKHLVRCRSNRDRYIDRFKRFGCVALG